MDIISHGATKVLLRNLISVFFCLATAVHLQLSAQRTKISIKMNVSSVCMTVGRLRAIT